MLEKKFSPFDANSVKPISGNLYIYLLGSGFTDDERLPPTSQLGMVAQCRLVEAMRIYRQIENSILVCSAGAVNGSETQASVTRKAAILLGADSARIITIDRPTTTQEEAIAFSQIVKTDISVALVTDAIHMARAYKLFLRQGFHPIAAPTNFKVLNPQHNHSFEWAPSISNISLMDVLIHEYLGSIKAMFS